MPRLSRGQIIAPPKLMHITSQVINKAGHGTAVDWWGLGMLMYEMLTGLPPWYTKDRQKLFERLRGAPLVIPKNVSAPSASIIGGLLTRNPAKRLGTLGAIQVNTPAPPPHKGEHKLVGLRVPEGGIW